MSTLEDSYEDDAAIDAAVASDAFGLNSLVEQDGEAVDDTGTRKIAALPLKNTVANPDVLLEVCAVSCITAQTAGRIGYGLGMVY